MAMWDVAHLRQHRKVILLFVLMVLLPAVIFGVLIVLKRPGDVITRDDFLRQIWGEGVYVTHRTVDTHVAALRKKIEEDLEHPAYILSVRNVGYRFNENITPS